MQITRQPQPGDVLWVDRGLYHHCGIYEGDGNVIHFSSPCDCEISAQNAEIRRDTFEWFERGCPVKVLDIEGGFSPAETLRRARSRLGEKGYDLAANNCDHFAFWCRTGEHRSLQVDEVKAALREVGSISREMDRKTGEAVGSVMELVCQIHDVVEAFKAPKFG